MSKSANQSLHLLASHKKLLPRPELDLALREAGRGGRRLEDLLREGGKVPAAELDKLLATRERHGRRCVACQEVTYLLPGQNPSTTRCEHCEGALGEVPGGGRPAAAAQPAAGAAQGCPVCAQPLEVQPPDAPAGAPHKGAVACRACSVRHHGHCWKKAGRCSQCGEEMFVSERRSQRAAAVTPVEPQKRPEAAPPASEEPAGGPVLERERRAPGVGASRTTKPPSRAQELRHAGGGFGYEPMEPEAAPKGKLGMPITPDSTELPDRVSGRGADAPPDSAFAPPASAFAPPAGHVARAQPVQGAGPPPPPARPLREEIGLVLSYPFRGPEGPAVVLLGAFFFALLALLPSWGVFVVGTLLTYPTAYLVKIAEEAMRGQTTLPAWPDFNPLELIGLAFRMFFALLAGMLPLLVVVIVLFVKGPSGPALMTIGHQAHLAASGTPDVPAGTSASEATFQALDGSEVKLGGGKWTIVGLLGMDRADDTGFTEMAESLPRGGFGVLIMDAYQIHDLDRVGQAFGGQVRVLAAYADPGWKVMRSKWPFLKFPGDEEAAQPEPEPDPVEPDPVEEPAGEEDPFDVRGDVEAGLKDAMGVASRGNAATSGGPDLGGAGFLGTPGAARPAENPFKSLQFVRGTGFTWPAPFDKGKGWPRVYVVDPQGRVVREYATGVYDQKLYADVANLMVGGKGDTWPSRLPPHVVGVAAPGTGAWVLVVLTYLAGLFYTPIALLLTVGFTSAFLAFNYPAGMRAIEVSFRDYLTLFLLLVAVTAGVAGLQFVAEAVLRLFLPASIGGAVAWFVCAALAFYGLTVKAFGIGRYYFANADRLAWFKS